MNTDIPLNITAGQVLLMIFLLAILIGVIVQIVLSMTNNNSNVAVNGENSSNLKKKEKTLTSWIEKKDLLYWLLLILLGSISLFTYQYKDATEVISHWGFAGTIVSIILAVIAIGFTLFQTLSSNLSSEKIAVSADKIEKVTNNLDTETLLESSEIMNNAATFLKDKIFTIEERLFSLGADQKTVIELASKGFSSDNNDKVEILSENDIANYNLDKFIDETYNKLPFKPKLFIYSYFCLIAFNLNIDSKFQNEIVEIMTKKDEKLKLSRDTILFANVGSEATTYAFVNNMGILLQFENLHMKEKEEILTKCKKFLTSQFDYVTAIDEYIQKIEN